MPIKKRFGKFVKHLPDNSVEIRTPASCTSWDMDFRLRIIRDYLPPNAMLDKNTYHNRFDPSRVYKVQGKLVMFQQPATVLENMPNSYVITKTQVIDVAAGRAMFLRHSEPAMRILMVYSFLVEKSFDGVSLFDTYDWHP